MPKHTSIRTYVCVCILCMVGYMLFNIHGSITLLSLYKAKDEPTARQCITLISLNGRTDFVTTIFKQASKLTYLFLFFFFLLFFSSAFFRFFSIFLRSFFFTNACQSNSLCGDNGGSTVLHCSVS